MVRERSPPRTSSAQLRSPVKDPLQQRPPLAKYLHSHLTPTDETSLTPLGSISAKMQSPTTQSTRPTADEREAPTVEFGKASPLRNPLRQPKKSSPSIFVPKQRPQNFIRPANAPRPPTEVSSGSSQSFSVPAGLRRDPPAHDVLRQHWKDDDDDAFIMINKPANPPFRSVHPPQRPTFSSIPTSSSNPPSIPMNATVDLTSDDDNDRFDPDAVIQADRNSFGAPDPYMYLDSNQANENIKNLLEGAFDDEAEKGRTRLRRRVRKMEKESKDAQSFANRLAALSIENKENKLADEGREEEEEDEDDGTVEGLTVKLLPHQVEGVSWMVDKEIGASKTRGVLPKGGILADDMGLGKTVQSVTLMLTNPRPALDAKPEHPKQKLPPKEVSKSTLVIAPLALIKQWESEIKTKVTKSHALKVLVHHGANRAKSADQLRKYDVVITTYSTLTSEHAGSNMLVTGGTRIGCMGVYWYRLILDEAHSIKNRNAKSTQACYALESWYRWCLTGTPMQNNLDELQSLIKFLRIKPYNELNSWRDQITKPMKSGRGGLAMRRLQIFLQAFMKRRTKDILKQEGALNFGGKKDKDGQEKGGMQIVKREILTIACDLDEAEQEFYDQLQARADKRLQQMENAHKNDYMGALVLLLRLRQACNHPELVERAMSNDKDAMTTGSLVVPGSRTPGTKSRGVQDDEMDNLANLLGDVSVSNKTCDVCQAKLSPSETECGAIRCSECEEDLDALKRKKRVGKERKSDEARDLKAQQRRARSRRVIEDSDEEVDDDADGTADDEDAEGGGESLATIDSERSAEDVSEVVDSPSRARRRTRESSTLSENSEDEEPETDDSEQDETCDESDSEADILDGVALSGKTKHTPSTKIRHLLRILRKESPEHKTIVFSQFTTMLDLIEPHLETSNIRFVRYDGSMRPDEREESLNSLRNNPRTRVLLCSLKCGSLGLNLTAASRVVIVEPFWNPFVEEQAIDRVHRLNQTIDVKVYRLTVRNSVEERIVELQQKKRELANAAIEGGKGAGKLSMQDILGLFKRDAEHGAHDEHDREMWEKFGGGGFADIGRNMASSTPKKMFREHDVYGRRW